MFKALKQWAQELYRQLRVLQALALNGQLDRMTHCLILLTIAYVLSPIDLIPDMIPVLGMLDELILIPLLIWLIKNRIPPEVWLAAERQVDGDLQVGAGWIRGTVVAILVSWTLLVVGALCLVFRHSDIG